MGNKEGDVVLVDHVSRTLKTLERGDVVIAVCPYEPKKLVCKRLVAMEGDACPPPTHGKDQGISRVPKATSGSRATTCSTPRTRGTTAPSRTTSFEAGSSSSSGPSRRPAPYRGSTPRRPLCDHTFVYHIKKKLFCVCY